MKNVIHLFHLKEINLLWQSSKNLLFSHSMESIWYCLVGIKVLKCQALLAP